MKKYVISLGILLLLLMGIVSPVASADAVFPAKNEEFWVLGNNTKEKTLENGHGSPEVMLAPYNPKFVKYEEEGNLRTLRQRATLGQVFSAQKGALPERHQTGLVPEPVDLSNLSEITPKINSGNPDKNAKSLELLSREKPTPDYYDSRAQNRVTPVKDQGPASVCWAFATYASLESYLMPDEKRDFSENNMKNLLSSAYKEGFDRAPSAEGNELEAAAYLTRWSGPVEESKDPYSAASTISPTGLAVQKHVQEILFLPDRESPLDNEEIKRAVQTYGAVYTGIYYDNACYSNKGHSYYYKGTASSNHAVAIAGWDDSFDRNRFSEVPPGDGAFIVKNSWGPDWGENGYFYVSYYDSNLGKTNAVFTAENTENYTSIYQYDPLGWDRSLGYGESSNWAANVFTSKGEGTLKAVSFYTTDSNCNYEIYIYTSPEPGPVNQEGPALSTSGNIPVAGYHTIPLGSGVQLKAGEKFSVVLKLKSQDYRYPIAIEAPVSGWSSKATANPGESFVSYDGKTWTDISKKVSNANVCIKAFTYSGKVPRPQKVLKPPAANFSAAPASGNAPLKVTFTDKSTGATSWKWNFGDGSGYSYEQNPVHTYSKAGSYTVKLTAINATGRTTKTKANYITVKPSVTRRPVAIFSVSPATGYSPLKVQFTDKSTGMPASWKWNFGDGTASIARNPVHTYTRAGKYTVTLTVKNTAGTNSKKIKNYINIVAAKKPVAAFSWVPGTGKTPLKVQFTDKSTGAAGWKWSFGDGTVSTARNPVHIYTKAGKYKVTLTVKNAAGSSRKTISGYITVSKGK